MEEIERTNQNSNEKLISRGAENGQIINTFRQFVSFDANKNSQYKKSLEKFNSGNVELIVVSRHVVEYIHFGIHNLVNSVILKTEVQEQSDKYNSLGKKKLSNNISTNDVTFEKSLANLIRTQLQDSYDNNVKEKSGLSQEKEQLQQYMTNNNLVGNADFNINEANEPFSERHEVKNLFHQYDVANNICNNYSSDDGKKNKMTPKFDSKLDSIPEETSQYYRIMSNFRENYIEKENGHVYTGQINNRGQKHGWGIEFWHDSLKIYEGQFEFDRKCGSGRSYWRSGIIRYEGYWENDHFHGHGIYYNTNGLRNKCGIFDMGFLIQRKDGLIVRFCDKKNKTPTKKMKADFLIQFEDLDYISTIVKMDSNLKTPLQIKNKRKANIINEKTKKLNDKKQCFSARSMEKNEETENNLAAGLKDEQHKQTFRSNDIKQTFTPIRKRNNKDVTLDLDSINKVTSNTITYEENFEFEEEIVIKYNNILPNVNKFINYTNEKQQPEIAKNSSVSHSVNTYRTSISEEKGTNAGTSKVDLNDIEELDEEIKRMDNEMQNIKKYQPTN